MTASVAIDHEMDFRADVGVLRSRLVAALAGVTPAQLSSWHRKGILQAHTAPGGVGVLRLYSWVDYMKARAARKLLDAGVKPHRLRESIEYLEQAVPHWYLIPLDEFAGQVLLDSSGRLRAAAHASQFVFPDVAKVESVLVSLKDEGALGALNAYADFIEMDPRILGGNPVIKGTGIETQFVAELAHRGVPPAQIVRSYRLTPEQVERAIDFTRKIAA